MSNSPEQKDAHTSNGRFNFFSLPYELRLEVYKWLINSDPLSWGPSNWKEIPHIPSVRVDVGIFGFKTISIVRELLDQVLHTRPLVVFAISEDFKPNYEGIELSMNIGRPCDAEQVQHIPWYCARIRFCKVTVRVWTSEDGGGTAVTWILKNLIQAPLLQSLELEFLFCCAGGTQIVSDKNCVVRMARDLMSWQKVTKLSYSNMEYDAEKKGRLTHCIEKVGGVWSEWSIESRRLNYYAYGCGLNLP